MLTISRITALFCLSAALDCSSYPQVPCEPGDEATIDSCRVSGGGQIGLPTALRWHWKTTQQLDLTNVRQSYGVKLIFEDGGTQDLPTVSPAGDGTSGGKVMLRVNLSDNLHLGGAELVFTPADPTSASSAPIRIPIRLYATPNWVPDSAAAVLGTTTLDIGAPRSVAVDSEHRVVTISKQAAATSSVVRGWAHDDQNNRFSAPSDFDALLYDTLPVPTALSVNSSQNHLHSTIISDLGPKNGLGSRWCRSNSAPTFTCDQVEVLQIPKLSVTAAYQDAIIGSTDSFDILLAPHSTVSTVPKLLAASTTSTMSGLTLTSLILPSDIVSDKASSIRLAAGRLLADQPAMFVVLQNSLDPNMPIKPQVLSRRGNAFVAAIDLAKALEAVLAQEGPVQALAIADLNGDKMDDLLFAKTGIPELYYIENQTVTPASPAFAKPVLLASISANTNSNLGFTKIDRIATGLIRSANANNPPVLSGCMDIAVINEQADPRIKKSTGGLLMAFINRPR